MKYIIFIFLFFSSITARTQIITTIAGNGSGLPCASGGMATAGAVIPYGLAADNSGNVYLAGRACEYVYKISPSGILTPFAGTGTGGYSGDGGPATAAQLGYPVAVAIDRWNNFFILENGHIRKVNASGIITTIAGTGVNGYSGDGGPATAAEFDQPEGIALDTAGNIYIADVNNNVIRKINTLGIISTFAGTGVSGFSGDGGPATVAKMHHPYRVATDWAGNVYFPEWSEHKIRKINSSGIISTIAGSSSPGYTGDGGPASAARLQIPSGIVADSLGNIFFGDQSTVVRKINAAGIITTFAGAFPSGFGGDGGPATAAFLSSPTNFAIDKFGNVYIADQSNFRVRKVGVGAGTTTNISNPTSDSRRYVDVYPTVAQNVLHISCSQKIADVIIYNLLGNIMSTHKFDDDNVEVNVTDLPKGFYLIRINGYETKRFLKE